MSTIVYSAALDGLCPIWAYLRHIVGRETPDCENDVAMYALSCPTTIFKCSYSAPCDVLVIFDREVVSRAQCLNTLCLDCYFSQLDCGIIDCVLECEQKGCCDYALCDLWCNS
jgi:hypothetical protein